MSSDKINCSQIFGANVRANNLKLLSVEKYLSQEKCTGLFATEFVVYVLARLVAENSLGLTMPLES